MGWKPKSRPSFFKVFFEDLTSYLRLPPVFVQKYGKTLPQKAKLRIASGETWNVELEEYCFSKGWTKFSLDVGLKMWDFLVFSLNIGESTFDVSVYGMNGCERRISATNYPVESSDSDEDDDVMILSKTQLVENEKHDYSLEEPHPQFEVFLKDHHKSRLFVRKSFALAAGLTKQKAVVLQYPPDQRCWPVMLDHDFPNLSQFRLDMTKGWPEFRIKYGLEFGKTYLFEYIPDKNVTEVKLID